MSPRYYDVSVFVQVFLVPVVSRLLCWRGLEVSESTREVLQHMLGGAFFVPLGFLFFPIDIMTCHKQVRA
jgi:hypothetical protein